MMDIGVARPSAHGHAMINTHTAFTIAYAIAGAGPQTAQMMKVTTAAIITVGTKYPDTRSASFWIGARLRCASETMCTIWDNRVSAPTFSARIRNDPV